MGAQVQDGQAEDAPSGVIRGYDAVTGKLAWAWDMCNPSLTGEPPEGQTYTRGTPNMWTSAAGDEELGYVYVPLGNSSVDYYGGNRKACENEYSSSLVAIDVTTGKPVWHFQTVHYDVWDYDLGSQPTLVDIPTDKGERAGGDPPEQAGRDLRARPAHRQAALPGRGAQGAEGRRRGGRAFADAAVLRLHTASRSRR